MSLFTDDFNVAHTQAHRQEKNESSSLLLNDVIIGRAIFSQYVKTGNINWACEKLFNFLINLKNLWF